MPIFSFAAIALLAQLPPAVVSAPAISPTAPSRLLFAWMPGEARCGRATVHAVTQRRPYLSLVFSSISPPKPIAYSFKIGADGRPGKITRISTNGYTPYAADIGPSLAASRFTPGVERPDCRIDYTPRITTYAQTPVEDLISYSLNPSDGALPREGWAAIFPATATCDKEPRPAPLTQVFPDFDKVPGTPGSRDWTMLAYDLDSRGKPEKISVLTGTQNRALDTAGTAALSRSRFTQGPKTGCRFPYYRAPEILEASASPEKEPLRPANATCPREIEWASQPPLRYPEPYRKRSIEGWALIGFDVAPWGGTGAIKVLASEPADDFGTAASALIRVGKVEVSGSGYTGCVERVRFLMGKPGLPANTTDPD